MAKLILYIFLLLGVLTAGAWAAALVEETFTSGSNGWTSRGGMVMQRVTNGFLEGTFLAQEVPTPSSAAFVATNEASGGAFTGSYLSADIDLLGFYFRARDVLPSLLQVRLHGSSLSFFRSIEPGSLGIDRWHRLLVPLNVAVGGWHGGSSEDFQLSLANVKGLEIQVGRNGASAQRYDVDGAGLFRLPRAQAATLGADGEWVITWTNIMSNVTYVVQGADHLDLAWTNLGVISGQVGQAAWMSSNRAAGGFGLRRLQAPVVE